MSSLGIEIDNKLNFEKHVTAPCQKAGRRLNALSRIHKYIGFQEMKMLLDSFVFSSFNYCPFVWHFYSNALSLIIKKIQERALRLYNVSYFSYNSLLLKAERRTREVSRLQRLTIEVFKNLKSLNLDFMHTYFKEGSHSARRENDLVVNRAKSTTFG